jgi:hypothetical protein
MRELQKFRRRIFRFENLESRSLLAGNVTTNFAGGVLTLTGDAAANNIQVSQLQNGDWQVKGIGTTIDNSHNAPTFTGVTDIATDMQGAADIVKVSGGTLSGDILIRDTGGGADIVTVNNIHATNITADTGAGNDSITLLNCNAAGSINTSGLDGADTIVVNKCHAAGGMNLDASGIVDGGDHVSVFASSAESLDIVTVDGSDTILVNNFVASIGEIFIDASESGAGNDTVTVIGVTAGTDLLIDVGNGSNVVSIHNATAATGLNVDAGGNSAGNNVISISGVRAGDESSVNTGDGNDAIAIVNSHFGQNQTPTDDVQGLYVESGLGRDAVSIVNTTAAGHLFVDTADLLQSGGGFLIPVGGGPLDGNDSIVLSQITVLKQSVVTNSGLAKDGTLILSTGDGADALALSGVNTDGAAEIYTTDFSTQDGADSVAIASSNFNRLDSSDFEFDPNQAPFSITTGLFIRAGAGNDIISIANVKVTEGTAIETSQGRDIVSISKLTTTSNTQFSNRFYFDLGSGDYDTLSIVASTARDAYFYGGGNTGDTLVKANNHIGAEFDNGFQYIIG